MTDEPRRHHYLFAHRDLRAVALDFGADLVAAGRAGQLNLRPVWDRLGQAVPEPDRLDGDGLALSHHRLGQYEAMLVRLPPAKYPAEAHYVLIVVPIIGGTVRYLTLEYAASPIDGRIYTVMGEWTKEAHVNYGEGPPAEPDAFLAAAGQLIGV